jgi:site-specific recombinase XerD
LLGVPCSRTEILVSKPPSNPGQLISFLTEPELAALLDAPDRDTWTGRRDHALILLAAQTGLRVSELIGLTRADLHLGHGAHVNCVGKGRKQRITPLTQSTVTIMRDWLREREGQPSDPLFPTRTGTALSRDAIEHRLAKHVATATQQCPQLQTKQITAHVLRHYVDGWVMWPAAVFPLLRLAPGSVPAT